MEDEIPVEIFKEKKTNPIFIDFKHSLKTTTALVSSKFIRMHTLIQISVRKELKLATIFDFLFHSFKLVKSMQLVVPCGPRAGCI